MHEFGRRFVLGSRGLLSLGSMRHAPLTRRFVSAGNGGFQGRRRLWSRMHAAMATASVVLGGGVFVFFCTTPAASLLVTAANALSLQGTLETGQERMLRRGNLLSVELVQRQVQRWMQKHIGWEVSFGEDSEMLANWRTGRVILQGLRVRCGEAGVSEDRVPDWSAAPSVPLNESYTRFDVKVERAELKLSLQRLWQGRGLVEEAVVEGVRGVLDRRWLRAREGRRQLADAVPGFDVSGGVQLQDVQVQVLQPRGYRSYVVTLLAARLPRLRQRWFFHDCLAAESAHGVFDGQALFAWHVPTGTANDCADVRRLRHFRMLGLDVQMLAQGQSSDHALAWVTRGSVDIEGFLQLPVEPRGQETARLWSADRGRDADADALLGTLREKLLMRLLRPGNASAGDIPGTLPPSPLDSFYTRLRPRLERLLSPGLLQLSDEAALVPGRLAAMLMERKPRTGRLKAPLLTPNTCPFAVGLARTMDTEGASSTGSTGDPRATAGLFMAASADSLALQVDFTFRNVRARLPPHHELPLARASLLRPVLAYINAHRPGIPLSAQLVVPRSAFRDAWCGWECGVFGGIAGALEGALEQLVWDPQRRMERIGRVSRWTFHELVRQMHTLMAPLE
jgi:hypothetical protein